MRTAQETRTEFATKLLRVFPSPQRLIDRGKPASNSYRQVMMTAGKVWFIDPMPSDPNRSWAGYDRDGNGISDLHFRGDNRAAFDEFATQQGWLVDGIEISSVNISYIDNLVLDPGIPGNLSKGPDLPGDPPKVAGTMAGFHANVRLGR